MHKNEGFLKSMWHTLTNHPAHQKGEEEASSTQNKDDAQSKNASDEQKKSSESGSA